MNMKRLLIFFLLFFLQGSVWCAQESTTGSSFDTKRNLLAEIVRDSSRKSFVLERKHIEAFTKDDDGEGIKKIVLNDKMYKDAPINMRKIIGQRTIIHERERDKLYYWAPIVFMYAVADLANSRANGILEGVLITSGAAMLGAGVASLLEPYNYTNGKMSEFVNNPKMNHSTLFFFYGFVNATMMMPMQWFYARQEPWLKMVIGIIDIAKLKCAAIFHYHMEVFVDSCRTEITLGDLVSGPLFANPNQPT